MMPHKIAESPSHDGGRERPACLHYPQLSSSEGFARAFPDVRVNGLIISVEPVAAIPDLDEMWIQLHRVWRGRDKAAVAELPKIVPYREFYRRIGLKPDRSPPSTQSLIQRYLLGETVKPLPPLPPIVNLINVVAVRTMVPLGAFDCDALVGAVMIDFAREGEQMVPIGGSSPVDIPSGAVVLRDDDKILSQFGYRDANAQKITDRTRRLMLLACQVPSITDQSVKRALDEAVAELRKACGAVPHYRLSLQ
jgi:DNA/RNA-binding domain of Phe-tRNA-synthetase-like protein